MKIVIYGERFLPTVGGVQTAIDLLARGFAKFNARQMDHESARLEVAVVTRTPADGMDDTALSYLVVRKPSFWKLTQLIRMADIVHLAGPCLLPMTISWFVRKPFVIVHHTYQSVCPNGLLLKKASQTVCPGHFVRKEFSECLRCCSQTMSTQRSVRALLLAFPRLWFSKRAAANIMVTNYVGGRLQLPRSRTIYLGIDEVEPLRSQSTTVQQNGLEVAYVGRLVSEKGLPLLLEAAKHLADASRPFKVTFIGDGPERARLTQLVRDLDLQDRVSFTGHLKGTELDRTVNRIGVVVMPSIWAETAGLAAIEQMMRGRLVIAADIGGLGEIVGNAGLKFTPGDWRSLAACLQRAIDDPKLVASLGSLARHRAERLFHGDRMMENQVALCREVLRR